MFEGCSSLTNIDINSLQLSNVKDMSYMFKNCIKLTSMEFHTFEGHKQIIKKGIFDGCDSLKKNMTSVLLDTGLEPIMEA